MLIQADPLTGEDRADQRPKGGTSRRAEGWAAVSP